MADYSTGKIYVLKSNETDQVYIGSTRSSLKQRFSKHKNHYKSFIAGKFGRITSFDILKFSDCWIELIELFPCQNKKELEIRECVLIKQTPSCCNKQHPGRTRQEYREQNKEQLKLKNRIHWNKNKDAINSRRREAYKNNPEPAKLRSKLFRQNNPEKKKAQCKAYYRKNKAKRAVKISCECGSSVTKGAYNTHLKSKKHERLLQEKH